MIYNFINIDADISGLYIHYLLKRVNPKFNILILESSNRIGGRIYKDGNSRLGAKFLHSNFIDISLEIQETYLVSEPSGKNIDCVLCSNNDFRMLGYGCWPIECKSTIIKNNDWLALTLHLLYHLIGGILSRLLSHYIIINNICNTQS